MKPCRQKLRYLAYPPTSLPIRDLFLLDWVEVRPQADVLEIGVGCGETTARLACMGASVKGIDIAAPVLKDLQYLESRYPCLSLQQVDVTSGAALDKTFNPIISFDVLEHVADPKAYFGFIGRHLDQGGVAHVLFPNETPETMHGITRFDSKEALVNVIGEVWTSATIYVAELGRWPRLVQACGFDSLRLFRSLLRNRGGGEGGPAQTFDDTVFYRYLRVWKKLSPLINAYWFVFLALCRLCGPVYRLRPVEPDDFTHDRHLYVRLVR